jgi:Ca2+-binding EF-hand superfamily protein
LAELEELYRRFERLDRDRSGTLSVEEILGIPEFAMNPLTPRILELLNFDEEEIDFTTFAQLMSVFHTKANNLEKLQCTMRCGLDFSCIPGLQPIRQWIHHQGRASGSA